MNTETADALVVFGITGDLAKQMTFRSLYRLDRRGLLNCPVIGVARQDWSLEHLSDHARQSIEATGESIDEDVFHRFAQRLRYVNGDFDDAKTYERLAEALKEFENPTFYLEIPPSLFATVVQGFAGVNLDQQRAARRR